MTYCVCQKDSTKKNWILDDESKQDRNWIGSNRQHLVAFGTRDDCFCASCGNFPRD